MSHAQVTLETTKYAEGKPFARSVSVAEAGASASYPQTHLTRTKLDELRRTSLRYMLAGGFAITSVFGAFALLINPTIWWIVLIDGLCLSAQAYVYFQRPLTKQTRLTIGALAIAFPPSLIMACWTAGIETSMLVPHLVTILFLIGLYDRRVILLASALCAVSLTVFILIDRNALSIFQPGVAWAVFVNLLGVAFVAGLSASGCNAIIGLVGSLEASGRESDRRAKLLDEQSEQLQAALETAEQERKDRLEMLEEVQRVRKREYERVAADFEQSISGVTQTVAKTALLLEQSSQQLKLNADQTGSDARKVVSSAETASKAVNTVAAGLAELSVSIAEVADDAGQQSFLSKDARECSGDGGQAIQKLAAQSHTIGEATHSIARIAERTNLLSLNAAIEAASAGPAGRGFSIVANEVKQLADQASDAATRIQAFLGGVQSGTLEAELSFEKIETAIGELDSKAKAIRYNVENHRQSAGTIETFARGAVDDADEMVKHSRALAERASRSKLLSDEVDEAVINLAEHVRQLEESSLQFRSKLDVA